MRPFRGHTKRNLKSNFDFCQITTPACFATKSTLIYSLFIGKKLACFIDKSYIHVFYIENWYAYNVIYIEMSYTHMLFIYIYITIYMLQYKGLRILSRYCSCQDSEFRSALETSSVDINKLLSKNFFLWMQCPKISLLLFKDGAFCKFVHR